LLSFSNWVGAPRLPRAFGRAGFEVVAFGFPGLLMMRSQGIDRALLVSDALRNAELLAEMLAAVERSRPDIVVPTDDLAILLLHLAQGQAGRSASEAARAALARSVGDPLHLRTVRSRKLLAKVARDAGVRAPRFAGVHDEASATAFAAEHGYPVVLKEEDSVAGMGVTVSRDALQLRASVSRYAANPASLKEGVLAQTFIEGSTAMRCVVAQGGRVLDGISAIKLETWPAPYGPSTCLEVMEHQEMTRTAETIVATLGYSGLASFDFILDGEGHAFLIEMNPRPTPIAHLGERFGHCLFRPLAAALGGQPSASPSPIALPSRVALFPQEWVRDPNSEHLRAGVFHDVPWDEPDLVAAYVEVGRQQMRFAAFRAQGARKPDLHSRLLELEASRSGSAESAPA
jgi:D-alanine-D-alanine ligase-like ATP-grasp enzyme